MKYSMEQRIRRAGYGHLWDDFNLGAEGVITLRGRAYLTRPCVLSPESRIPVGGIQYYQLTQAQCREVLWLMFGDDQEQVTVSACP